MEGNREADKKHEKLIEESKDKIKTQADYFGE